MALKGRERKGNSKYLENDHHKRFSRGFGHLENKDELRF
jgi:hypothetical protein